MARRLLGIVYKLADLLIMVAGFLLAASYAADMALGPVLAIRIRVVNFVSFVLLLLIWHLIFASVGMYRSARLSPRWVVSCRVIQATSLGTIAVICAGNVFNIRLISQTFVVAFWTATTVLYIAHRLIVRELLYSMRRRGRNLRNLVIVGTNARACDFARKLEGRQELGFRILGFVDEEWGGIEDFLESGRKLVTTPQHLIEFLRDNVVDEVVIALPLGSHYDRIARLAAICEEQGITVRFLSDLFNLKLAKTTVEVFEGEPLVTMGSNGSHDELAIAAKRMLDIAVSALAIVVLSPLLLAAALAVKLTSPGPVFFKQQRIGLNKRKFHVHKFRTMVADAERRIAEIAHLNEVSGPVFKIKNDPRLTPIGAILRKTSIDELPQLFDVLRGDMSLVGPRPLPVRDYQGFDKDWHRRRFSVRPGITCLWQVNGRSTVGFERWMELDMQYIDQWSLLLDLKILLRTIPAVFRGAGAA